MLIDVAVFNCFICFFDSKAFFSSVVYSEPLHSTPSGLLNAFSAHRALKIGSTRMSKIFGTGLECFFRDLWKHFKLGNKLDLKNLDRRFFAGDIRDCLTQTEINIPKLTDIVGWLSNITNVCIFYCTRLHKIDANVFSIPVQYRFLSWKLKVGNFKQRNKTLTFQLFIVFALDFFLVKSTICGRFFVGSRWISYIRKLFKSLIFRFSFALLPDSSVPTLERFPFKVNSFQSIFVFWVV